MIAVFSNWFPKFMAVGLITLLSFAAVGCETKAGTGALIGGATGAGLGAIIGNNSHGRTGAGAAIGGAIGALGGALIGNEMDKSDQHDAERDRYYNAPPPPPPQRVSQRDVIDWSNRGVRDEVIVDRIDRTGSVFRLSARDENHLRDSGVSEMVIRKMEDTDRR